MAVRIVLNRKAVDWYLKGNGGVLDDLKRRGDNIATTADANTGRGGDHRVETSVGITRARAAVITDTFNAMHREADQRTLTHALDAGRA